LEGANSTAPISYRAWFQCINPQCAATYPLNSVIYQCARCQSLLEVQHDIQALAQRDSMGWKKLFEDRYKKMIEGRRLYKTGADGERQYLTSEEIDSERLNAKREVDATCSSST